jgi:8-oxo-dGTP pyrophosphatase MutT (NUDIX family)
VRSAVKSLGKLQDDESIASNTVEALSPAEARSQKRDERQQLGASDTYPNPSPSPALDVQEALDSGDSETRARARSLALFKQVESGTDPEIEAARRRVEEERGYVLRTAAFRHERMDPVPARVAVPRSFVPRQRFERSTLGTQSADMQIRRSVTRDALRTLRTHTT